MSNDRMEFVAKSTSVALVALALCGLLLAAWTLAQPRSLTLDNTHGGTVSMAHRAP